MNKLCDEPNPLGDEILFYSSDGTESYKKLVKTSREMQNAKKGSSSNGKVMIEGSSAVGGDESVDGSSAICSELGSEIGIEMSSNETSTPIIPGIESEGEVLTVRQHQKFFQAYEEEADNLANDYADRLRMSHNIGEIKN
jgi:hypothetical protein